MDSDVTCGNEVSGLLLWLVLFAASATVGVVVVVVAEIDTDSDFCCCSCWPLSLFWSSHIPAARVVAVVVVGVVAEENTSVPMFGTREGSM